MTRIVSLEAENVKRLRAVHIKPEGPLVTISGKNGAGKSSVLDCIRFALGGKDEIQFKPIREGEDRAHIRLDLGDVVVTRVFRREEDGEVTTKVTLQSEEGAIFGSPQKMMDSLLGSLTFDPMGFMRMRPKEQFDTLRGFVPDVDFDRLAQLRQGSFTRRTEVNRDAKRAKAAAEAVAVPDDLPEELVSTEALMDAVEEAVEHNGRIEARRANRERKRDEVANLRTQAERLKAEATREREEAERRIARAELLEDNAGDLVKKAEEGEDQLAKAGPLPEPKDPDEPRAALRQAERTNEGIRTRMRREELLKEAAAHEEEAEKMTAAIARLDQEKADAIAKAELPVEGMGFADDYVTLNGLPFNQASSAQQLRASTAIAMAMNPKLRVLLVKDGGLLDSEGMAAMGEMAAAGDYQIWIETPTDAGEGVGIVIEDGAVRGAVEPEKPVPVQKVAEEAPRAAPRRRAAAQDGNLL